MTKQSKTALGVGTASIGGGLMAALGASQPVFGAILVAIGAVLVVADYLYGKYNRGKDLTLPKGVDEETAKEVAKAIQEEGPEVIEDVREFLNSKRQ